MKPEPKPKPEYSVEEKLLQLIACRNGGTPDFMGDAWPWQNLLADMAEETLLEIEMLRAAVRGA